MKAFKNRLEEMAEATVNALDYSDSKVEYPDIPGNNQLTVHPIIDLGTSAESALKLSLQAEKETLEEYYKVFDSLNKKKSI